MSQWTKAMINATSPKLEEIEIPEWVGSVFFRPVTPTEQSKLADLGTRYCPVKGCWAVLAKPDEAIPPLSEGTRRLSPMAEGPVTEESIVNSFEMEPADPE